MGVLAEKVSFLEEIVQKVAYSQLETNMSLNRLSYEMREFKDEMSEYKEWSKKQVEVTNKRIDDAQKTVEAINRQTEAINKRVDFSDKTVEAINKRTEAIDKNTEAINKRTDAINRTTDDMKKRTADSEKEMTDLKRQWAKQWGDLANKMGTVVEDIVLPNIPRIADVYFGCRELDFIAIRIKKRSVTDRSRRREFDAIAVCDKIFILNETKSSPEIRDIDKLAEFVQSRELYDYFPEYKDYRICPVFSSLSLDESFVRYLSRKGIYAMSMKDDTMEILNYEEIQ